MTGRAPMTEQVRQSHAVLDLPSRNLKDLEIERLLDLAHRPQPIRLREVGTGSGGIAHYFATHPELRCDAAAVDVCDDRLVRDGYEYHRVQGIELPFDDASFDVVITNHVIGRLGDATAQHQRLVEIRRVLKPDGTGYLAVPNRWMLTEPHYKWKFLSWLPRSLRTRYLRLMRKGEYYDCNPLTLPEAERLLQKAGFVAENVGVEALRLTLLIEGPVIPGSSLTAHLPDFFFRLLRRLMPTLIYRFRVREGSTPFNLIL